MAEIIYHIGKGKQFKNLKEFEKFIYNEKHKGKDIKVIFEQEKEPIKYIRDYVKLKSK